LEVTPDTILGDLRRFIQQEMPWDPQQATVDVALPDAAGGFLVPDGDISIRWVPDPEYRWVGSGAFRGELAVDGEVKRTFLCKAAVDAFGDMVVAAQDIPQNAQISLENLAMARKARSILREPGFEDPIEVAGQVAKVAISAGQVITRRMISPPRLVRRNQVVTVEVRLSNVLVVSRAKALADGRKGDVVRCQALGSREELQGVVREDGTVVIE
jgi:flagella basal body P-ring formation protein FlgA